MESIPASHPSSQWHTWHVSSPTIIVTISPIPSPIYCTYNQRYAGFMDQQHKNKSDLAKRWQSVCYLCCVLFLCTPFYKTISHLIFDQTEFWIWISGIRWISWRKELRILRHSRAFIWIFSGFMTNCQSVLNVPLSNQHSTKIQKIHIYHWRLGINASNQFVLLLVLLG